MKLYAFKSIFKRSICAVLIVFILLGQTAYASIAAEDETNLQYFQSIMNMIRDEYKGTLTDSQMIDGAVGGMLNSLDDYTTYYSPTEADSFMESITGDFGGVGMSMEISGDFIIVTNVYPDSPAEKAGIVQGDKIVEADGKSLIEATADDAVSIIRGEPGTTVKLGIVSIGNSDVKYIDVTREVISVNPVTYEIRNGIGYIKLEMFNENTDEFITKALDEMDKSGITKLILDLRDNPGGEVSQAVAVAQKFVPEGIITKLDYKSEKYSDIEYRSYLENPKYKLAVLVNGMSASASEIVSGAIQDTESGKLVGTRTFGKAKFQGIMPILTPEAFYKYKQQYGISIVNAFDLETYYGISPDIDEIAGYTKMTLGLYYTPIGRMIDGTGLLPDILAEDPKPISGIYINSIQKLTKTTKPALNAQGIDVYNAEKLLKVAGYEIGVPDITLDAKTFNAIKAFQKASGLYAYGVLDYTTQDALNSHLNTLITKYDNQYNAAVKLLN